MKVGKPKSKRVPVRLRHKIEKASAAKQRKQRKIAKKNPEWRSRLKKDPGVPNLFPYKEKILQEIEESRRRKEEDAIRKKEEAKARREGRVIGDEITPAAAVEQEDEDVLLDYDVSEEEDIDEPMEEDSSNHMAALLASARASAKRYDRENGMAFDEGEDMQEDDSEEDETSPMDRFAKAESSSNKDTSRRAFDQAFKQVLADSDVLIYVLDARDPQGTRSQTIEQAITANPNKRLILILNKIDLVPAQSLKSWLLYLRRYFPTLPFRGVGSSASSTAKPFDHKHLTPQFTANNLIRALKAFANSRNASTSTKTPTTIGILGYPNTGKSTLINALTARLSGAGPRRTGKDVPVGAEAGITTAVRAVKLDKQLTLLDSPGIVFPSSTTSAKKPTPTSTGGSETESERQARLILLNALPAREIGDPVPAVGLLLDRLAVSSEELQLHALGAYGIAPGTLRTTGADRTTDFLVHVARARGRLGKGGKPNLDAAARTVLGDWREGRIRWWAEVPKAEVEEGAERKEVVREWAKEFEIEGLWGGGVKDDEQEEVVEGDVVMDAR